MKVLLLKDVYKLGRAGDVKRVADGYGRNFLLPQGLAMLATPGALKMVDHIRAKANEQRAILNKEMDAIAKKIDGMTLTFAAKASETGKLYGSVTTQMIADKLKAKSEVELTRRQLDVQPLRTLGTFKVAVRLTVDLIPHLTVIVYREGETPPVDEKAPQEAPEAAPQAEETTAA